MERKKRAPGGGRKPIPVEERRSRGSAVTLRLSPLEEARLRTWAPPGVGLGLAIREHMLGYIAGLRSSSIDTAREFLARLDAGEDVFVECDGWDAPAEAIVSLRRAAESGDRRDLPPCTVRLRVGAWSGVIPGVVELGTREG